MELTTLLERMKMEHLLAQLDGVCEQAAKGDLDFKGFPALERHSAARFRGEHRRALARGDRFDVSWTAKISIGNRCSRRPVT
jgi:hypothetical protein